MKSIHLDGSTLSVARSSLLIVDMQERLMPAMHGADAQCRKVEVLARAAALLSVPVLATEHWPEKIGHTVPALRTLIGQSYSKTHFDASREAAFISTLPEDRRQILLVGSEAHVCVLQTGLGLARAGWQPVLVADGVGSRHPEDREAGLGRWRACGLPVVTTEMVLYEWLDTPEHPAFAQILAWVKTF